MFQNLYRGISFVRTGFTLKPAYARLRFYIKNVKFVEQMNTIRNT